MMEIEKEMDVEGTHIKCIQTTEDSIKILDYDYKKCNGCGICVDLCPEKALQLGPIVEIATGLDAPPVLIDLEACVFCGMCACFCPVSAYEMTLNDKNYMDLDEYPHLDSKAEPNERCKPCALCEPVCPTEAITTVFYPTRDDLGPLREDVEGTITVDPEKCNLCGICPKFCKAFIILEKEPHPKDLVPYEQLLVDEDLCDYCELCVGICPEEAIEVKGKRLDVEMEFSGSIDIDQSLCIGCKRCDIVCPYDAMDVTKPFEGSIRLLERELPKCDPVGCHGCFNVCPSDCWYIPPDGIIDVEEDQCIFCGACANACHIHTIEVERHGVHHTEVKNTPWAIEWKDAIKSIVTGLKRRPDTSTAVVPPEIEKVPLPEIEVPERDSHLLQLAGDRLSLIEPVMRKAKVRFIWEREQISPAAEKIATRIKEAESHSNEGEEMDE
jgi:4Fe-4S ferredoxin